MVFQTFGQVENDILLNSGSLMHYFESPGDIMRYDLATSVFHPSFDCLGMIGYLNSDRET